VVSCHVDRVELTKPLTRILPVVSEAAEPDDGPLGGFACFVALETPPTGPEGAGRPTSERRPPRPRPRVWRRVLRISSRLVSSLEDMLIGRARCKAASGSRQVSDVVGSGKCSKSGTSRGGCTAMGATAYDGCDETKERAGWGGARHGNRIRESDL
jgi:hypothetical protein